MNTDDLLDGDLSAGNRYALLPDAGKGLRFTNYLLDLVLMIVFGAAIMIGVVLLFPESDIMNGSFMSDDNVFSDYILNALLIIIYYPLTEGLLEGKSLAKYITRTRAVRTDGSTVTMKDVFMRSLSRLVPFEHFSFLGSSDRGWHDKWTDTKVVNERHLKSDVY